LWRRRLAGGFSVPRAHAKNAGGTPAPQCITRFYRIKQASLVVKSLHKIFFWSALLFRFAFLEFVLDFRRAHS
jgi:hypothetical protein